MEYFGLGNWKGTHVRNTTKIYNILKLVYHIIHGSLKKIIVDHGALMCEVD